MLPRKLRHSFYLIAALGMIVYAVPRLEFGGPWDAAGVFGAVWILFALLVVAANLNELLLMNEEKRARMVRIKRAKALAWERKAFRRAKG